MDKRIVIAAIVICAILTVWTIVTREANKRREAKKVSLVKNWGWHIHLQVSNFNRLAERYPQDLNDTVPDGRSLLDLLEESLGHRDFEVSEAGDKIIYGFYAIYYQTDTPASLPYTISFIDRDNRKYHLYPPLGG